jgi:hypothetical protein
LHQTKTLKENPLSASLGWIHLSQADRDRVGTVLDMLRPEGMVDELGLSTIRDALANVMFPGISTIQTRAKYFFIVPYIIWEYQYLPQKNRKEKNASSYLRQREYEIMWELADTYRAIDGSGVIGATKKKPQKIARRPSTIYWGGLATFGIIDTRGLSVEAYLKQTFRGRFTDLLSEREGDDGPADDPDAAYERTSGIRVTPPSKWTLDLRLELTKEEAQILKSRIMDKAGHRLLGQLLKDDILWSCFSGASSFRDFAWSAKSKAMDEDVRGDFILAHDFSTLMYGAHCLYNHTLQQKAFSSDVHLDTWYNYVADLPDRMIDFNQFNPERLFRYATTTRDTTALFVRTWWREAQAGFPKIKPLQEMIMEQEHRAKGPKARLRWNKMDDVVRDQWIGLDHFAYRFNQVKTIVTDIQNALP